jgi:hypothetical protein
VVASPNIHQKLPYDSSVDDASDVHSLDGSSVNSSYSLSQHRHHRRNQLIVIRSREVDKKEIRELVAKIVTPPKPKLPLQIPPQHSDCVRTTEGKSESGDAGTKTARSVENGHRRSVSLDSTFVKKNLSNHNAAGVCTDIAPRQTTDIPKAKIDPEISLELAAKRGIVRLNSVSGSVLAASTCRGGSCGSPLGFTAVCDVSGGGDNAEHNSVGGSDVLALRPQFSNPQILQQLQQQHQQQEVRSSPSRRVLLPFEPAISPNPQSAQIAVSTVGTTAALRSKDSMVRLSSLGSLRGFATTGAAGGGSAMSAKAPQVRGISLGKIDRLAVAAEAAAATRLSEQAVAVAERRMSLLLLGGDMETEEDQHQQQEQQQQQGRAEKQ